MEVFKTAAIALFSLGMIAVFVGGLLALGERFGISNPHKQDEN